MVLGVLALWVLTDRPEQATWLPAADREWLTRTMNAEHAPRKHIGHASLARTLASGRVWLLCAVYFMNTSVTYGIFLWLPKMLREASGAGGFSLSGMTALPFTAALVAMVLVGRHSDRTGERKLHVAACAVTASVGLLLAAASQHNIWLLVLSFTLSQMGQRSVMSVFWAIPPLFLGGTGAAAGIGLINAIGNLGGAAGPSMMGWLRESTGGYSRRAARPGGGPDRRSDRRQPASPAATGARGRAGAHRCLSGRHRGDTLPFRAIEQPRS